MRAYHQKRSGRAVHFHITMRVILEFFVRKLRQQGYRVIAASVGDQHVHALAELPVNRARVDRILGRCKQRASQAVSRELPGTIWSAGGECRPIRDKQHLHNAYQYIRERQERGTIVWSHRPDENWINFDVPVKIMGAAPPRPV